MPNHKNFSFKNFSRCFIIAEISANHGQSFSRAVSLVKKAKSCGVDAVKFQVYTPDTLTINVDNRHFHIKHAKWGGQTLYELYHDAYTPWNWLPKLKKIAEDLGLIFFATAFDKTAVDFLEEMNVLFHKIASFELVDIPLIEYAAKTRKPLLMSTGMATLAEIHDAVNAARKGKAKEIALLKCVSSYPAKPEEMNLTTITDLKKRFKCPIGLSDHTMDIGVSVASVSLGATIIEKHFTDDRRRKTADSFFSMEPHEMKSLVDNVRFVEASLGKPFYGITAHQKSSLVFRRSLFVVQDIQKGEKLTVDNVRSIRPAGGLAPKHYSAILNKKVKVKITKGTPLTWKMIN